mgnify:FL=1|jgi:SAM-dependent methyltransferase
MNKQTKKALKEFAYRTLGADLSDGIRNLINKKDIVFYDKNLSRKVEALVKENRRRNADGEYDLALLIKLHELFSTIDLSDHYIFNNLLNSARQRYRYLLSSGLDLEGKVVSDFGAGHGENLIVANEFKLKSARGFDFSDDRFSSHVNDISPKARETIKFNTLDLVRDDIGVDNSDIVLSFSAFEHFDDPGFVLDKCYRLLKKGGYLYAEFAAFNAPYAIHRKIFSGVPHVQNIFSDSVAYKFFYDHLKINEGINRYTKEKITDGNPFPEVNRWKISDYERVFLDPEKWEIVNYRKVYNYKYDWMIKIFSDSFQGMSKDDLYVDYLKFLIRKK